MDSNLIGFVVAGVGPVIAAPVAALGTRRLFAVFFREGAALFTGTEVHRELAHGAAMSMAINNALIFSLAWWAAVGISAAGQSMFLIVAPFIAAVLAGVWATTAAVRSKLHASAGDAWLVGLLVFAGGNLPLIVIMPLLLGLVPHRGG